MTKLNCFQSLLDLLWPICDLKKSFVACPPTLGRIILRSQYHDNSSISLLKCYAGTLKLRSYLLKVWVFDLFLGHEGTSGAFETDKFLADFSKVMMNYTSEPNIVDTFVLSFNIFLFKDYSHLKNIVMAGCKGYIGSLGDNFVMAPVAPECKNAHGNVTIWLC